MGMQSMADKLYGHTIFIYSHFMDPYGPPHLPPRGHYSDHYGPLPYREWHGGIRSPPHPPRRQRSIPRSPSPKRDRHKRRKHNKATVSGSSESSPEPSHHHKHHRKVRVITMTLRPPSLSLSLSLRSPVNITAGLWTARRSY